MIDKELYDTFPAEFSGRAAALWEIFGQRIIDHEWRGQPFRSRPKEGIVLNKVVPYVRLTLTWQAKEYAAVWNDVERMEDLAGGSHQGSVEIDGQPAARKDANGNKRLSDYTAPPTEGDEVEAKATLVCPLAQRKQRLHTGDMMTYGPQWRLCKRWNWRGVRCLLVNRWVPIPAEWSYDRPIDYWTGYVFFGNPDVYRTEPDEEVTVQDLPDKTGDPGIHLPKVTYPNAHFATGPDGGGWIGWDNNFDDPDDVPEDRPEAWHMDKDEAVEATEILAKGVKELWELHNLGPAEHYGGGAPNAPVS